MLVPYSDDMPHLATYWPMTGRDAFGAITYGDPVVIQCRWQNKNDLFVDALGRERVSSAVIYPAHEVAIEGMLARGEHASTKPHIVGAKQIMAVGDSPDLDDAITLYKVWL